MAHFIISTLEPGSCDARFESGVPTFIILRFMQQDFTCTTIRTYVYVKFKDIVHVSYDIRVLQSEVTRGILALFIKWLKDVITLHQAIYH